MTRGGTLIPLTRELKVGMRLTVSKELRKRRWAPNEQNLEVEKFCIANALHPNKDLRPPDWTREFNYIYHRVKVGPSPDVE